MKFAKLYQQTVEDEGIPQDWVESGIQYKALKKCINRVVEELKQVGLERETLHALLQYGEGSPQKTQEPDLIEKDLQNDTASLASATSLVSYKFDGDLRNFFPKIVVAVDKRSNTPVDAKLSAKTLQNLKAMAVDSRLQKYVSRDDSVSENDGPANPCEFEVEEHASDTPCKNLEEGRTLHKTLEGETQHSCPSEDCLLFRADAVSIISGYGPLSFGYDNSSIVVVDDDSSKPELGVCMDTQQNQFVETLGVCLDTQQKQFVEVLDDEPFAEDRVPLLPDGLLTDSETSSVCTSPSSPDVSAPDEFDTQSASPLQSDSEASGSVPVSSKEQDQVRFIEIHLESDSIFFHMLMSELKSLDQFNHDQEEHLTDEVDQLRFALTSLVDPKVRKSDMYIWRELFKEYMSSNIFFATLESDHGEHDVDTARRKLIHFAARALGFNSTAQMLSALGMDPATNLGATANSTNSKELLEIERASTAKIESVLAKFFNSTDTISGLIKGSSATPSTGGSKILAKLRQNHLSGIRGDRKNLIAQFQNRDSYASFRRFWTLNTALLRVLQFQAMNRLALTKILKKFDKQTALDARVSFPGFLGLDSLAKSPLPASVPFLSHSLAKSICFVITERLLPVTPQIDDFLCPICLSVAFKPIRLDCTHVFCVRCLIQLQRAREDKCPMCRQNVVLKADELNLDKEHLEFLKLYFPKETKIKQQEMEKQIVDEQMSHLKQSGECAVM